jgi:hypothetical protein
LKKKNFVCKINKTAFSLSFSNALDIFAAQKNKERRGKYVGGFRNIEHFGKNLFSHMYMQ